MLKEQGIREYLNKKDIAFNEIIIYHFYISQILIYCTTNWKLSILYKICMD